MNRIIDLPLMDDDMPVQGARGCPTADGQFVPDSMTMGRYLELQDQAARKRVSKDFDAILVDIRAGKFSSVKQFAAVIGKSRANDFRRVALGQKLMDGTQWKACFKRMRTVNG